MDRSLGQEVQRFLHDRNFLVSLFVAKQVVSLVESSSTIISDSMRYRHLRDTSTKTWTSFQKQWNKTAVECDQLVDADRMSSSDTKGPVPPNIQDAGHHWLEVFDSDGHNLGLVVAQWNPGARRWSPSGYVGLGGYLDTAYWRYVAPVTMPDF